MKPTMSNAMSVAAVDHLVLLSCSSCLCLLLRAALQLPEPELGTVGIARRERSKEV
jgi:hypothetical protein